MRHNIKDIINSFVRFNYSRKTNRLFQQWLASTDKADEKEAALNELWSNTKAKADRSTDDAFRKVMRNVGIELVPESRLYRLPVLRYAAAVAIICVSIISVSLFLGRSTEHTVAMVEHYVKKGSTATITLPDGSQVLLNSESLLYYPQHFEGDQRKVYLMGEATFDVAKNTEKPFIVHSSDVETMALGTKFNVKAYAEENEIATTLLQGKVKVDCKNDSIYFLDSGEQVLYNKTTRQSRQLVANMESVTAWHRGEILLNEATVEEVISVLERHFGIEFRMSGEDVGKTDRYYFEFKKNASIEDVLDIMKIVIGNFKYSIHNNICYISWN